jgi:hypothetical protein
VRIVRPLLVAGNDKLAPSVMHFDRPAGVTCPGKSRLCYSRCYARRNRFAYPQVKERLLWSYEQSKRGDFVERMSDELYRKGILLMRWHVSGDIYSPAYARKILEIVGRSLHTTFWLYTRSWRVKTIFPLVKALSLMPNMKLWLSADADTGYPANGTTAGQRGVAHRRSVVKSHALITDNCGGGTMPPGTEEIRPMEQTKSSCPACGSRGYQFRSRKKIEAAAEKGEPEE